MKDYEKVRVKHANNQFKKLGSATTNKTVTTLKIIKENFENEKFLHELFLTTRKGAKMRNFFSDYTQSLWRRRGTGFIYDPNFSKDMLFFQRAL